MAGPPQERDREPIRLPQTFRQALVEKGAEYSGRWRDVSINQPANENEKVRLGNLITMHQILGTRMRGELDKVAPGHFMVALEAVTERITHQDSSAVATRRVRKLSTALGKIAAWVGTLPDKQAGEQSVDEFLDQSLTGVELALTKNPQALDAVVKLESSRKFLMHLKTVFANQGGKVIDPLLAALISDVVSEIQLGLAGNQEDALREFADAFLANLEPIPD